MIKKFESFDNIPKMEKKEAKKKLESMIGSKIWLHEKEDIENYALTEEELIKWCKDWDEKKILMNVNDFDIDGCNIRFYGVDDGDYNAWIVMCDKKVVAYGYSSD